MKQYVKYPIILLLLLPIISLLYYNSINFSKDILDSIYITIQYIIGVTFISSFIGIISAFTIVFFNFPYRDFLKKAYLIPLIFPTYIIVMLYGDLSNSFLSLYGLILTTSLVTFPYVYLIMYSSLSSTSQLYIDSSNTLGISKYTMFKKIIFPLSIPAILTSIVLVISDTLSEFGGSIYSGVNTITVYIYEQWFILYDYSTAVGGSIIVITFVILIMFVKNKIQISGFNPTTIKEINRINTGKYGIFISLLLFIPLVFSVIIPLLILNSWVVLTYGSYNFDIQPFINSLSIAVLVASLCIIFSYIILYFFKNNNIKWLLTFNYAIPGLILSIAMLQLSNNIILPFIFFYVYVLKYIPLTISTIESGISKIDRKMYYGAKSVGKTSSWFVRNVQFPLSLQPALLGGLLVFLDVIRELPITLLLRPLNVETISTKIFYYFSSEQVMMVAPYFVIIILLSAIPLFFIHKEN